MPSIRWSDFDVRLVGQVLWRERRRAAVIVAAAAALGVGYSLLLPVRYEARMSLSPAAPESNPLRLGSALAGLGGQLGLDIGGARPQLRFYVRLLQSYWFLSNLARTSVAGDTTVYWELQREPFPAAGADSSRKLDVVVTKLQRLLDVDADERANIFTVAVRMPTRAAALAASRRAIELLTQFDTHVRRLQASENRRFVAERTDSARMQLAAVEDSLAGFLTRNRLYQTSPDLQLQYQRLERRVALVQEIYVTLARNLEQARIDEVREAPLLTVVDPPHVAWRKAEPRRSKVVVTFLAAGMLLVLGLSWLVASVPAQSLSTTE
ncbi:MAG TPA: hypothetical protein VLX90_20810 [Steroidobacteraceae bacterium]|nr:hypothetical protein [Steroidobacteraceae bacterium]